MDAVGLNRFTGSALLACYVLNVPVRLTQAIRDYIAPVRRFVNVL